MLFRSRGYGNLGSEFAVNIHRHIVVEPRGTHDIEILFKLILKVPVVGNTADTPNSPRPVGFEPTTSGLDLPVLYRLSYEASTGAGWANL